MMSMQIRIPKLFGSAALALTLASCGSDTVEVPQIEACESGQGSVGCAFTATRLYRGDPSKTGSDTIVVVNPSTETPAEVQLVKFGYGQEPVTIAPGEAHYFSLSEAPVGSIISARKAGAGLRILADSPVAAALMAPLDHSTSNEGSLLVPDGALGTRYVIASYGTFVDLEHPIGGGIPSYFTIVGQADGTSLEFWPTAAIAPGEGVPTVEAGEQGSLSLDAGEVVHIAAAGLGDLSGTVVEASAPIWVAGGVRCATVPGGADGHCDHLQEVLRPTTSWAEDYPLAAAPRRTNEPHVWRVYAGAAGITGEAETIEGLASEVFELDGAGDYVEFETYGIDSFWVHADGPVQVVQYLANRNMAGNLGDPSMIQATPEAAWRHDYAIATGLGFDQDYLQITRLAGGSAVEIDGVPVEGFESNAGIEVANVLVDAGVHRVTSGEAFGLAQFGYNNGADGNTFSSYALPGGFGP